MADSDIVVQIRTTPPSFALLDWAQAIADEELNSGIPAEVMVQIERSAEVYSRIELITAAAQSCAHFVAEGMIGRAVQEMLAQPEKKILCSNREWAKEVARLWNLEDDDWSYYIQMESDNLELIAGLRRSVTATSSVQHYRSSLKAARPS